MTAEVLAFLRDLSFWQWVGLILLVGSFRLFSVRVTTKGGE